MSTTEHEKDRLWLILITGHGGMFPDVVIVSGCGIVFKPKIYLVAFVTNIEYF